jgi:hypothetical protein
MLRRAALALVVAVAASAGPAAAQTATTGTPQALFTRLITDDPGAAKEIRDALRSRRVFVDADVSFAELTGDGRQDAIARVDSGGAGGTIAVFVFSADGAQKLRPVYRSQRLYRALVSTDGATLVVRTPRYGAADDLCCPPAFVQRSLTWSAGAQRLLVRATQTVPASGR